MEQIKKLLQLPKHEYYEAHLQIINPVLPVKLTPKEIEVLAAFMSLEGSLAEYRFGPAGKKAVMKRLNLTPQGLSNHMRELKSKEFILEAKDEEDKDTGIINILPLLIPEKSEQVYMFKLVNTN
jgi:DNA-binding MarR family transcriptional regulator